MKELLIGIPIGILIVGIFYVTGWFLFGNERDEVGENIFAGFMVWFAIALFGLGAYAVGSLVVHHARPPTAEKP